MTSLNLESVALTLVAEGKGILAADETAPTLLTSHGANLVVNDLAELVG
jgi:fructose-bisphosphate aldolase class 1